MMKIMEEWGKMPPNWVNYVQVQSCDETAAKAASLEGKVCLPPADIQGTGRFAVLADPQGAGFSVIALAAMHKG
jgi:predicted enzyme related to lactoylglutathione lyase